jgi:hypothetical protein
MILKVIKQTGQSTKIKEIVQIPSSINFIMKEGI